MALKMFRQNFTTGKKWQTESSWVSWGRANLLHGVCRGLWKCANIFMVCSEEARKIGEVNQDRTSVVKWSRSGIKRRHQCKLQDSKFVWPSPVPDPCSLSYVFIESYL